MKDIENDKLMSELGDKLGRFREEPPEGMFERIEQTLLAGGIIAGEPAQEAAKEPEVVVIPLWQRPIFRGVAAALVAASVCLAVIVTGGRQELEQMEGVVAQQVEEIDAPAQNVGTEGQEVEQLAEASPSEVAADNNLVADIVTESGRSATTLQRESVARFATMESPDVVRTEVAQEVTQEESAESGTKTSRVRRKGESELVARAKRRDNSARRSESELEEYWRGVMAQDQSTKRVERPIQVGLYTANLGVNQGDVMVNNISNSQLLVKENIQLDGGSYLSPMMVQEQKVDKLEHSMPVTVGVAVSVPLGDWVSVESGLLYTSLNSRGESNGSMSSYVRTRSMDYVGVPLAVRLDVVDFGNLTLYGRLGVTGEVCVAAKDKFFLDGSLNYNAKLTEFDRFSLSLDASAGANYALWENLGLFGEVGCTYWKAPENYPENYRTLHPLRLSTRVGVRFEFN